MALSEAITIGLLALAILQAVGAIVWSKWYREAKQAQIDALKTRIKTLEQLTPKALIEQVEALQKFNEIHTAALGNQLEQTKKKMNEIEAEKGAQLAQARQAYDRLDQDYQALRLAAEEHRPPAYLTLVNSVASSQALAASTSSEVPESVVRLHETIGDTLSPTLYDAYDRANQAVQKLAKIYRAAEQRNEKSKKK